MGSASVLHQETAKLFYFFQGEIDLEGDQIS